MFEDAKNLWIIHIGRTPDVARRAREEGFVAIGWPALGDLSPFSTRPQMREHCERTFPSWSPGKISANYGQVFRFAHEIEIGDPVILPLKETREIAVGKVVGEYEHRIDDPHLVERGRANIRRVEWMSFLPRTAFSQEALYSFGSALTVSTSNDHLDEVRALLTGVPRAPIAPKRAALELPADQDVEIELTEREESDAELVRQQTEDHLLKAWARTAQEFEELTAALFRAMGYHARTTSATGDHGIDVIAHPDPLGVTPPILKIQCKSGTTSIGGKDARELKGALGTNEKGVLIALGGFARQAEEIARNHPDIVLIDGPRFVALFLEHYERLEASWRTKYPLTPVFVPAR